MSNKNELFIKVIAIGSGGTNAVNQMFRKGIKDVGYVICNTDVKRLESSPVPNKIQLGSQPIIRQKVSIKPEQGHQAAIESLTEIRKELSAETKMVFITAALGGGTGTGAAPVIAKTSKDLGILTIGVVTLPFRFEGSQRRKQAIEGIKVLEKCVDTLLIIDTEKYQEKTVVLPAMQAFAFADDLLFLAVKSISEMITVHGRLAIEFGDIKVILSNKGLALMNSGTIKNIESINFVIKNIFDMFLSDKINVNKASNVIARIVTGKKNASMDVYNEINEAILRIVGFEADLIWLNVVDESFDNEIAVTIILAGYKFDEISEKILVA